MSLLLLDLTPSWPASRSRHCAAPAGRCHRPHCIHTSYGNDIKTKANKNFDNGEANTFERKKIVFKAKRTRLEVRKLFSKRSEHA
jgi:hypothetical protein